eukprot:TRINITY_DN14119_c0_g1_i1.p1 TRINITY_DN14119_c0_g1~~TRINITY_DN14119_c0_g1_i1.p1  ORF type:complete len:192 (-),score=51.72 TRINITY_DN14119_c0_g1_i1:82-621(-)
MATTRGTKAEEALCVVLRNGRRAALSASDTVSLGGVTRALHAAARASLLGRARGLWRWELHTPPDSWGSYENETITVALDPRGTFAYTRNESGCDGYSREYGSSAKSATGVWSLVRTETTIKVSLKGTASETGSFDSFREYLEKGEVVVHKSSSTSTFAWDIPLDKLISDYTHALLKQP